MSSAFGKGLNEKRLKTWLLVFFLALAIPALLLIIRAYGQVKWEVFHQYRVLAEELSARIDTDMRRLIEAEEARSFADYSFLVLAGDPKSNLVQRSRLSNYPLDIELPGLVGYFQVDSAGLFSSPVLPQRHSNYRDFGISDNELTDRRALKDQLHGILNRLGGGAKSRADAAQTAPQSKAELDFDVVHAPVAQTFAPNASQNVFDRLSSVGEGQSQRQVLSDYGRVEDLKLDSRLEKKSREQSRAKQADIARDLTTGKRASRKEQIAVYETELAAADGFSDDEVKLGESGAFAPESEEKVEEVVAPAAIVQQPTSRVRFFESEIDPMTFDVLDDVHFVMFRNVWREGERYIQGAVIRRARFIERTIEAVYQSAALSSMSNLLTAYQGDVLTAYGARESGPYLSRSDLRGELLYRTRLSSPLSGLELIYSVTELPLGPSVRYLAWVAFALVAVLIGGCYAIYRFGVGQMNLYRQQQDFISAVSHELKTPLTSIRMYSEMLKAGWAEEEKKTSYYAFIHDESERLSRLIANVLQLARMTRGNHQIEPKPMKVVELLERTTPKLNSQLQSAGFELHKDFHQDALDETIAIDDDAFTQILINLVDNAIKFSPDDAARRIDLKCIRQSDGRICVTVRDYGPGIMKDQMRKIFELFYRSENELTRETVGTGIGLALVHQLTTAMNGKVDVKNCDPGAEFSLTFNSTGL